MELNASVFDEFPLIQTNRLSLRNILIKDAEQIFEMRANKQVNQFIPRPEMNEPESAVELVEKTQLAYSNKQAIPWAGILRDQNVIIGTCGLTNIDFTNLRAEIGGELAINYWGKSIALEAVTAIVEFGMNELNLHTLEAHVSPDNRGSIHLLEHLGFKKEAHFVDCGYFNGQFLDMAIYTLLNKNH